MNIRFRCNIMQTEVTNIILQKVLLLTAKQRKILEMTESFLDVGQTKEAWDKLKQSVAENKIDFDKGDLAATSWIK